MADSNSHSKPIPKGSTILPYSEDFRNSPNFAARLFDFCIRKPKSVLIDAHELNPNKPNTQYKLLNKHNIDMSCYDEILDVYLKIVIAKELNEHDLLFINNTMKFLSTKGLVTDEFLLNLEKSIREYGYISSDWDADLPASDEVVVTWLGAVPNVLPNAPSGSGEGCHQTPDPLRYFNYAGNKYYTKEFWYIVGNMKTLQEENKVPDAIFHNYMAPIERGDIIQSKLNLTKCLYCANVLKSLNYFNTEGLLIEVYSSKYIRLDKQIDDLVSEMKKLLHQMQDSSVKLKQFVCSSEHKTPLCEACGLQSSWLSTFKKRGIHIREADNYNNKHVWHNRDKN